MVSLCIQVSKIVQVGMSDVDFLVGCYPGLALATAMPGGN